MRTEIPEVGRQDAGQEIDRSLMSDRNLPFLQLFYNNFTHGVTPQQPLERCGLEARAIWWALLFSKVVYLLGVKLVVGGATSFSIFDYVICRNLRG